VPSRSVVSSAFALAALFTAYAASAQSIEYRPDAKLWVIQAGNFTYAMGVDERNWLQSLYWGPRIDRAGDIRAAHSLPERAAFDLPSTTTPQEYAAWGAGLYTEPDLKAIFAAVYSWAATALLAILIGFQAREPWLGLAWMLLATCFLGSTRAGSHRAAEASP